MPDRWEWDATKAPAALNSTVTASAPEPDTAGGRIYLNSAAIIQITDQPSPEEAMEADLMLPDGVLTHRGY